ncbi:hypothetical protein GSI_12016 [Ganoderma sinense ZZ0214-1]|uniref:BTB domain-containing protein n=1 Tax=Ganoderma sinense ZZ0214-1 TaxID=1077348 RepID=A0A2G8RXM1_9APHY|nr:hypothetical protein GSI_12016 [Ganoderma sinense ZZ0214-1]
MSSSPTRLKRPRSETEEEAVKQEPSRLPAPVAPVIPGVLAVGPDSEGDPRPPPLRRDAEFWYSDGSIILVAKDVEFRVYGGLLAEQSSVFRAMFAEENPVRLVPLKPGHRDQLTIPCPVIQLADAPEDLRRILRVIVSRKSTGYFDARKPSFYETSAYIRLGFKYKIKELYKESLQLLKSHYTSNLERWTKHDYWRPPHWHTDRYSISVVNLARLIGEPTILPTALLACMYMDEDLVQGVECEDGTREMLSPKDLGRCFRAMKEISKAKALSIRRTCAEVLSEACKVQAMCIVGLRLARLQHLDAIVSGFGSETGDPFQSMDAVGEVKLAMCAHCKVLVLERDRKERQLLWSQLPQLLGIEVPGWGKPVSRPESQVS